MTIPDTAFGTRVRTRLREERVVWLITVGADGTPQPNPVWFLWDGAASVLIYNRPDATRLRHLRARPRASLHFDADSGGGDVVVLAGSAGQIQAPAPHENAEYLAKYGEAMARVSESAAAFAEVYSEPLEFRIARVRGF